MDNFESQDFDAMVRLTPNVLVLLVVPHCLPKLHSGKPACQGWVVFPSTRTM